MVITSPQKQVLESKNNYIIINGLRYSGRTYTLDLKALQYKRSIIVDINQSFLETHKDYLSKILNQEIKHNLIKTESNTIKLMTPEDDFSNVNVDAILVDNYNLLCDRFNLSNFKSDIILVNNMKISPDLCRQAEIITL